MAFTAPDVAPQPIPGARVSSAANDTTFGAGPGLQAEGQEVQKIATESGDIASLEKIRADQTAVEEAQAKGSALATDVLYNPQTGVLGSKGTDALQAQKNGNEKLRRGLNAISETLHGEDQKGSFNKWALEHDSAIARTMAAHVDTQLKEHDKNWFDSLLKDSSGLAALAHGNSQQVALAFKTVNDNAIAFAQRNRLDKDGAVEFIQDANDKVHTAVIDGMLKFQPDDSAQKYFDANKGGMSPAAQLVSSKALEEGNVRNRSTLQANQIWKATGGDLTASFAKADKIENPAVQEMVRARLREAQKDKKDSEDADQDDKYQQAWGLVKKASLSGSPIKLQDTVPPMLWTKLDPKNQDNLKKLAFNNETNVQKWTEFSLMPPEALKQLTAQDMQGTYLPEFAPKDRDKAMKMWQQAQSNSVDSYVSHDQNTLIKEYAQNMGIAGLAPGHDPAKLKGDRAKDFGNYLSAAQQAITNFQATKLGGTRKATEEETKAVLDGIHMKMIGQTTLPIINYSIGGRAVYGSQYSTPFEEIPDKAKSDLSAFAKQLGVNATPEQIQRAYYAYQQKDIASVRKAFQ